MVAGMTYDLRFVIYDLRFKCWDFNLTYRRSAALLFWVSYQR